jgi:hypothetical protein
MPQASGILVEHESGRPLPGLLVHIYNVFQSLPSEIEDHARWDELYATGWKGIALVGLGSTQSDAGGRFELTYELDDAGPAASRGLNLWYAILGPEVAGSSCPKVVHVGCTLRMNASAQEFLAVRITRERLDRAGARSSGALATPRGLDPAELHAHIEKLAIPVARPQSAERFSKQLRDAQRAAKRERQRRGVAGKRSHGFPSALPLRSKGGGPLAAGTELGFDEERKMLTLRIRGDALRPLRFDSVRRQPPSEEGDDAGLRVVIDEERARYSLLLAEVPETLRAADDGPGALLLEFLRRRPTR